MLKAIYSALLVCCVAALLAFPASAYDYRIAPPGAGLFAKPTSLDADYVIVSEENINTDRSKDAALVPPPFGSPSAASPLGAVTQTAPENVGAATPPPLSAPYCGSIRLTELTEGLLYNEGHFAVLGIPRLGLSVRVYEGTSEDAMGRGAGHFESTSVWDGNVAVAGHNRGVPHNFGGIHTLLPGDVITYATRLGERSYTVMSVEKISELDVSVLDGSTEDILTLVTCVMGEPAYRWCVRALLAVA